jgi:hypothetical protein
MAGQFLYPRIHPGQPLQPRAQAHTQSCWCTSVKQINKLIGAIQREGMTLIPLKLYFNEQGQGQAGTGLAKGKKLHDKRETEKNRDWSRVKKAGC